MAMTPRLGRLSWRGAALGAACALASWWVGRLEPARALEAWALDYCFVSRGTRPSDARERIVIVGLDDESLDALGKPMALAGPELARVIRYLKGRGAAAIGVDLILRSGTGEGSEAGAGEVGVAAYEAGNVVFPAISPGVGVLGPPAAWIIPPAEPAMVDVTEDDDHFVRRQQLTFAVAGRAFVQFDLKLAAIARGEDIDDEGGLRLGDRRVPLDGEGLLRINYVGPAGRFPIVPFRRVLEESRGVGASPPDDPFRGAIAIIGVTARSQQDRHATPFANNAFRYLAGGDPGLMDGPEVHANILATLLDRAFVVEPGWPTSLPALLAVGSALGMAYARLNLSRGAMLAVAHHFGWKLACVAAFARLSWRIEMVSMLLLGGSAYAATFALRWSRLRRMFGAVKSEAIARALEANDASIDLRGEERDLTVLFADIRGFTIFSEARPPRQVVAVLNAYFGAIVPAVEAQGGTIDKYIGDGMMVLFGAPDSAEDHAARGVRAAVAMVRRVEELRPTWEALGFPGLRIGIGVHTGRAVVGTIGSPRRLDFTAIGDTVNAASRIEGQTKHLGSAILVSAATYERIDAGERARLGCDPTAEEVALPGRHQPMPLHRVRGPADPSQPSPG